MDGGEVVIVLASALAHWYYVVYVIGSETPADVAAPLVPLQNPPPGLVPPLGQRC